MLFQLHKAQLQWETLPTANFTCCNGRPFQLANLNKKLFRAWKVLFWFSPPDTRQWAFQVLFQLPKAQLQWETLPTGKLKINWGPEKLYFDFLLQTPGSELFRCFSSCPKRSCNGRPFQLANLKKTFSEPEKLYFDFPFQKTFRGRESFATAPPPSHVWTRLAPQKPRELLILMERGEVINSEFRLSEARYTN